MSQPDPTDKVHWPCGCITWSQGHTFYLQACPLGEACEVVIIALSESRKQGNEVRLEE